VAAGFDHSLALRSDGTVWAWGLGNPGQLGNSATFDSAVPVQTWLQVTSIAAGWNAAYAVRSNSAGATVRSWGGDACGDLGLGATVTGATPMVTIPQPAIGIATPTSSGGIVIAWGYNVHGELGTGSTAPITGMVHVVGLSGVTQVASGGDPFSLAVYSQPQGTA
jgi:alpha-tubulin suppressor-like RCC1 family protein